MQEKSKEDVERMITKREEKRGEIAGEKNSNKEKKSKLSTQKIFIWFLLIIIFVTVIFFILTRNAINSFFLFTGAIVFFSLYFYMRKKLEYYNRIKKLERAFPDFISLMASNLRAGMTIDRALLTSARKEFEPLDKEIMQVGKDILTAREITEALYDMGERTHSEEIKKTIQLIISGIRSGGNLAILLEQTANHMRERVYVKKRAASNVLMYVIFIFFAVAVGAPLLFGLSTVLVEVMSNIFSGVSAENVNINLPFTITEINISTTFIFYYAIIFVIVTAILASLMLGLISKGQEKEGTRYMLLLVIVGVAVFLITRFVLMRYFVNFFG